MSQRIKQIATARIGRYIGYDQGGMNADQAVGRTDAASGRPALDDTHYSFYDQTLALARADFHAYTTDLAAYEADLVKDYDAKKYERDVHLSGKRNTLVDNKTKVLDELARAKGPNSAAMRKAKEDAEKAETAVRLLSSELARPLRTHMAGIYLFLMVAVALIEVPVNKLAFEFFFQETPLISLSIALMVGVIFALFAHFVGMWMKQANNYEKAKQKWGYYAGSVFLLSLSLFAMYILAAMRQHFISVLESDNNTSFADLLQSEGLGATAANVISTEFGTAGWTLLTINLIIFALATIVSFVRHDSHPDYEKLEKAKKKTSKVYLAMVQAYEKAFNELVKKNDQEIAAVDRQIEAVNAKIDEIDAEQKAAAKSRPANLKVVSMAVVNRLLSYQNGNISARKDGRPACFVRPIESNISNYISEGLTDVHAPVHDAAGGNQHNLHVVS